MQAEDVFMPLRKLLKAKQIQLSGKIYTGTFYTKWEREKELLYMYVKLLISKEEAVN